MVSSSRASSTSTGPRSDRGRTSTPALLHLTPARPVPASRLSRLLDGAGTQRAAATTASPSRSRPAPPLTSPPVSRPRRAIRCPADDWPDIAGVRDHDSRRQASGQEISGMLLADPTVGASPGPDRLGTEQAAPGRMTDSESPSDSGRFSFLAEAPLEPAMGVRGGLPDICWWLLQSWLHAFNMLGLRRCRIPSRRRCNPRHRHFAAQRHPR